MLKFPIALALLFTSNLSAASVIAVDMNQDDEYNAFFDAVSNLYWSGSNAFGALNFMKAEEAAAASTIEGITNWRLPTLADFQTLYDDLGNNNGVMNVGPFVSYKAQYWTSSLAPGFIGGWYSYFIPANGGSLTGESIHYVGLPVNVWAVANGPIENTVPEPTTIALLGMGLIGVYLSTCRTKPAGLTET